MNIDTQERLKAMDDAWRDAVPPAGGIEMPPDGDYQAVVERFDFFESSKNGHLLLKTELSVTSGNHSGWPVSTLNDLEDPERLGWAKKHLQTLGLEVDPLSTLESRLTEAVHVPVEITIKTKGEYRNVYVNKRLGDAGAVPAGAAKSAKHPDDDIPFARGRLAPRGEWTWPTRSTSAPRR